MIITASIILAEAYEKCHYDDYESAPEGAEVVLLISFVADVIIAIALSGGL